jgi:hypothetical protein
MKMKKLALVLSVIVVLGFCFSGCMSYSTLQSAKTLDPGTLQLGAGGAFPATENGMGVILEGSARVGVAKNFDIGAKYSLPLLWFFDAKLQLVKEPVAISADLGWSYFHYDGDFSRSSKGTTTCWYPTILAGQDHWYCGAKRVYASLDAQFEFYGLYTYQASGWIYTHLFVGGIIGDKVRLLPEVNFIVPDGGKTLIVPAIGLQFRID